MKCFLIFWMLTESLLLCGQNINPSQNKVYRFNEVMRIDLLMSETNKEVLLDDIDIESNEYLPAKAIVRNSKIDTILYHVGVRLRGNTSRDKDKKSIKISFTTFGGEKFYNNKKFNLKAEVNDPSLLREYLSLHMYRNYGVPAARACFVELYINNEYMGVYLNVEQIDDEFVDRRYTDNEAGNLFRCYWSASLSNQNDVWNNGIYELKINEERNDRDGLEALVQSIIKANSSTVDSMVGAHLNLDAYIKQLAVESFIGHWDGYTRNMNNFYLYEDTTTHKFQFIPYDLDNTWGIDWGFVDYESETPKDWKNTNSPLSVKILKAPELYDEYATHLVTFADNFFNRNYIIPLFDSLQKLLKPYVQKDIYYTYDNGYTYSDFLKGTDEAWGSHVWYGLEDYLSLRRSKYLPELSKYTSLGIVEANDPSEPLKYNQFTNPVLSVDRVNSLSDINFFPNPVRDNLFYITLTGGLKERIKIFDCMGRSVAFDIRNNGGNQYRIELVNNPANGIYQLIVGTESTPLILAE